MHGGVAVNPEDGRAGTLLGETASGMWKLGSGLGCRSEPVEQNPELLLVWMTAGPADPCTAGSMPKLRSDLQEARSQ